MSERCIRLAMSGCSDPTTAGSSYPEDVALLHHGKQANPHFPC